MSVIYGVEERGVTGGANALVRNKGKHGVFEDWDPDTRVKLRSQNLCYARWVQNDDTTAVVPKRLVSWKAAGYGTDIDDYTGADDLATAGAVDEFLPAAGCPTTEHFWCFYKGPHTLETDGTAISQGDRLTPAGTGYVDVMDTTPSSDADAVLQVTATVGIATESAAAVAGTDFVAWLDVPFAG